MASATDIITYIGVPLAVLGVLPILYNAAQCLLIRYRLLRSLPASARAFFNLHPNPVGGTVVCSFRSPTFEFNDILVKVKRCHAQIDIQPLPNVELYGLGASWMRLIHAIGLEPQRKKQVQRILVDSSLDVEPVTLECDWKSLVSLSLGLGVSPLDPVLHSLGGGTDAISEQNLHSAALRSETGQRLIGIRWHQGLPCLELTEQCSSWSIHRSLAYTLHMITKREGKWEVLHFVPVTTDTYRTPIAQICDCESITSSPVEFSILQNIHCAIAWTLYFEELQHQIPCETIPIPQSLLLLQFEVIEELRQMSTETLRTRVSTIFPTDATLVANILSALTSTWSSPEHQELLNGLGGGANKSTIKDPRHPEPDTSLRPTQLRSNAQSLDTEKAISSGRSTDSLFSEKSNSKTATNGKFDLYPILQSSPTFKSLSLAYSPSTVITTNSYQRASDIPDKATATIDVGDRSKPEALLARLIIALCPMRLSTAPRGWVTSIASGALKYKVGAGGGETMVRKLMGYDGGRFRIE